MSSRPQPWHAPSTTPPPARAKDCPECGATESVRRDFCDVCYAELDEASWPPIVVELDDFLFTHEDR